MAGGFHVSPLIILQCFRVFLPCFSSRKKAGKSAIIAYIFLFFGNALWIVGANVQLTQITEKKMLMLAMEIKEKQICYNK